MIPSSVKNTSQQCAVVVDEENQNMKQPSDSIETETPAVVTKRKQSGGTKDDEQEKTRKQQRTTAVVAKQELQASLTEKIANNGNHGNSDNIAILMNSIPDSVQLKIYDTLMDIRANHRRCCIIQFLEKRRKDTDDDKHWIDLYDYEDGDFKLHEVKDGYLDGFNKDLPEKIRYSLEMHDASGLDGYYHAPSVYINKYIIPMNIYGTQQEVELFELRIREERDWLYTLCLFYDKTYQHLWNMKTLFKKEQDFPRLDLVESDTNPLRMERVIIDCVEEGIEAANSDDEDDFWADEICEDVEKFNQLKQMTEEADDYGDLRDVDEFPDIRSIILARV